MKTTVISILSVILLNIAFIDSSLASGEKAEKQAEKRAIHNAIEQIVDYPEYAKKDGIQGYVNVIFRINENGSIEIQSSVSNESILKDYVLKAMERASLKNYNYDTEEVYGIKFNFRLL